MRFIFITLNILLALVAFTSAARICVIDARNCANTLNVCGRFGQSNLCQRFNTLCELQAANCQQTAQYTRVAASNCNNLAAGVRRSCSGLNSNFNVQPIVIRG